jgi:hypothetical protein
LGGGGDQQPAVDDEQQPAVGIGGQHLALDDEQQSVPKVTTQRKKKGHNEESDCEITSKQCRLFHQEDNSSSDFSFTNNVVHVYQGALDNSESEEESVATICEEKEWRVSEKIVHNNVCTVCGVKSGSALVPCKSCCYIYCRDCHVPAINDSAEDVKCSYCVESDMLDAAGLSYSDMKDNDERVKVREAVYMFLLHCISHCNCF